MTDIELKYYIALQPKIREAMGEWQPGDRGYSDGIEYFFTGTVWWSDTKYYQFKSVEDGVSHIDTQVTDSIIRLPLPIDPRNPERGLWGMVNWNRFFVMVDGNGRMTIAFDDYEGKYIADNDTPTLALLKVLAAQWKVEVPNE